MSESALSASVVAAVEDLELAARLVVEGLRAGTHRSPFHGFSAEFQQHRPYRPGDDLKHLDWKLLARTERLYSRQFRETTSMSAMLVVDTSASMAFPEEGPSKLRYAQLLAAALAYLTVTAGDSAGLMTSMDGDLAYRPARSGRSHLRSLVAAVDGLRATGVWPAPEVIARAGELLRRRGLVIVISDFYDQEDEVRAALRRLIHRGHDVAMIQLTSDEETTFPYRDELEFEDLETGRRRVVHPAEVGEAYRTAVRSFHERCREAAHRDGIDHVLISTARPPSSSLRDFLVRRASRGGRVVRGQVGAG